MFCFHLDSAEVNMFCCALQRVVRGCISLMLLIATSKALQEIVLSIKPNLLPNQPKFKPIIKIVETDLIFV